MMYRYRWISDERQENWVTMVDEAGRFDRWWRLGLGTTLRHCGDLWRLERRGDKWRETQNKMSFLKQRKNCTKVSFILCWKVRQFKNQRSETSPRIPSQAIVVLIEGLWLIGENSTTKAYKELIWSWSSRILTLFTWWVLIFDGVNFVCTVASCGVEVTGGLRCNQFVADRELPLKL